MSRAHHCPRPRPFAVLVIDAPNVDQTLATNLGLDTCTRFTPSMVKLLRRNRLNYKELLDWWCATNPGARARAAVFVNIRPGDAAKQEWIDSLRALGYHVVAKPKLHPNDDIDHEMVDYIQEFRTRHLMGRDKAKEHWEHSPDELTRVAVMSHDRARFNSVFVGLTAVDVECLYVGLPHEVAQPTPIAEYLNADEIKDLYPSWTKRFRGRFRRRQATPATQAV